MRMPYGAVTEADRQVKRLMGRVLRSARLKRGWTLQELAALMPTPIEWRTILSYERGSRAVSLERLYEFSVTLGESMAAMVDRFERLMRDPSDLTLTVDVQLIAADTLEEFAGIQRWARNRLADGSGVVQVTPERVRDLAAVAGVTKPSLAHYLLGFEDER
jgi:transcriptional regulator with XRE-family HTH domain